MNNMTIYQTKVYTYSGRTPAENGVYGNLQTLINKMYITKSALRDSMGITTYVSRTDVLEDNTSTTKKLFTMEFWGMSCLIIFKNETIKNELESDLLSYLSDRLSEFNTNTKKFTIESEIRSLTAQKLLMN